MIAAPPADFERWNRALRGAFRKGQQARVDGLQMAACPYEDVRKDCGRLTWSRSFVTAWTDGWRWQDEAEKRAAVTTFYEDRAGRPGLFSTR